MASSLFQRTSSFAPHEHLPVGPSSHGESLRVEAAKQDGPTSSDLEHWYKALNEIAQEPPFEHRSSVWSEIEDIRDEIYAYLR